jgi:hypothetical protein
MKTFATLIGAAVLSATVTGGAQAASLSITPSVLQVGVGDLFSVQVAVADLGLFSAPSLGAYDIDVAYDSSRLSLQTVVFGDAALADQLDLFGLGSQTSATPVAAGSYNVYELSFDAPSDLNTLQADAFGLFSVSFRALAAGEATISLGVNDLSDADGVSLPVTTASNAQVSVVPLPGAAWLLLSGCGALTAAARRRHLSQC